MRVEENNFVLSVSEWVYANCTRKDLCRVNRMWLRHLDRTIGRDAPLWEKEEEYKRWCNSDFSNKEWDACVIKKEIRDGGELLTNFRKVAISLE